MNRAIKRAISIFLAFFFFISTMGGVMGGFMGHGITQHSENVTNVYEPIVEVATFEESSSEEITDVVETTTAEAKIENIYYDCPLSHDLQDYIRELCDENEIPMSLVIAIIDVESEFDMNAISSTNDYGLMQINKSNHKWLRKHGVTDVLDPYQNVLGGIIILSECYKGNMSKALMEYNLGLGKASKLWKKGVYSTYYSRLVLSTKEVYDAQV